MGGEVVCPIAMLAPACLQLPAPLPGTQAQQLEKPLSAWDQLAKKLPPAWGWAPLWRGQAGTRRILPHARAPHPTALSLGMALAPVLHLAPVPVLSFSLVPVLQPAPALSLSLVLSPAHDPSQDPGPGLGLATALWQAGLARGAAAALCASVALLSPPTPGVEPGCEVASGRCPGG